MHMIHLTVTFLHSDDGVDWDWGSLCRRRLSLSGFIDISEWLGHYLVTIQEGAPA